MSLVICIQSFEELECPVAPSCEDAEQDVAQRMSSMAADAGRSSVLLFGKTATGDDVTVLVEQPVAVHVRVPHGFGQSSARALARILPTVDASELCFRTPLRGYVPPLSSTDPVDAPTKLPFVRLRFPSWKKASEFVRVTKNYNNPHKRAAESRSWSWEKALERAGLSAWLPPPPLGGLDNKDSSSDNEADTFFSVHHLETPWEAFCNAVDHKLRTVAIGPEASRLCVTLGSWVTFAHFQHDSLQRKEWRFTRAKLHGSATVAQVTGVDNSRAPAHRTVLSWDLEVTSADRKFPVMGDHRDAIICCGCAQTTDNGATLHCKALCFGPQLALSQPPPHFDVVSFATEQDLINAVAATFAGSDGRGFNSVLSGYNIVGFDLMYLFGRALLYWMAHRCQSFEKMARRVEHACKDVREFARLRAALDAGELHMRDFRARTKLLFQDKFFDHELDVGDACWAAGSTNAGTGGDLFEVPFIDHVLAQAYTHHTQGTETYRTFTEADFAHFRSGPDTSALFHCGLVPFLPVKLVSARVPVGGRDICTDKFGNGGFTVLDLYQHFVKNEKFPSFKLDFVAKQVLDTSRAENAKIDLPAIEMMNLWAHGDDAGRLRVLEYCVRDAQLPLLMAKARGVWDVFAHAALHRVKANDYLFRGRSACTQSMYRKFMNLTGYLDNHGTAGGEGGASTGSGGDDTSFEGATVQAAKVGCHKLVVTLDFASMYPSIIREFNLGWGSFLNHNQAVPSNVPVDTHHVDAASGRPPLRVMRAYPDLMPLVITCLLNERAAVRKMIGELRAQGNHEQADLLETYQMSLKLSANGQYGLTGAKGKLRDQRIAATTTYLGRILIQRTKEFCAQQGFECIYGDTDSVFLTCPPDVKTFEQACAAAGRLCDRVNSDPAALGAYDNINVTVDNVFRRLMLKGKKMYAAVNRYGKFVAKGLSFVRRDYCKFQQQATEALVRQVVQATDGESDADAAIHVVKTLMTHLDALIDNRLPAAAYAITQAVRGAAPAATSVSGGPAKRPRNAVQEIAQRINKLIQNGALCARSFVASGQRIEVVRVEQPHAKAVCQRRTTGGQKVYQAADLLEALEVVELHGLKVDRTYALQMIKQGLKEMPIDPHGVFGAVFQHAEACLAKSRSQSKAMAQFVSGGAASAARGRWDKVLEHVRKCVAANKTKIKGKSKQTQLTFRSGN
jgi:DNA polymerase elongation subunit (family B)